MLFLYLVCNMNKTIKRNIYYFLMFKIKIILYSNIFYLKKKMKFLLHLTIFMIKTFKLYR